MPSKVFKVFSLCNEINLDNVASHFGINKKYKWEDFLTLTENYLKGIVLVPENKSVIVFSFGSIVFINMEHHEIVDIVNYLKRVEKNLANPTYDFSDDYMLEIGNGKPQINYDSMSVTEYQDFQVEILSIVLAKSVALEKIESDITHLLDYVENIVTLLEKGAFSIKDKELAKISAKILGFKFNTISYIMLLDKPDITWENQNSEVLYTQLSHLFELNERYEKIQSKTEILMDITEVFGALTHQKRGNKLEWMVIILIFIEILLTLIEYIFLK